MRESGRAHAVASSQRRQARPRGSGQITSPIRDLRDRHQMVLTLLGAKRPADVQSGWRSTAVLGLGTRSLIASVVAVPDAETSALMVDVHRHLRAGLSPASALATVQASAAVDDSRTLAAAAGFVCFGAS